MHPSRLSLLSALIVGLCCSALASEKVGTPLTPWTEGYLDIHHINTGRGESSLLILPDGTSMLVDAASSLEASDWSTKPKPNDSRTPGEWIARYAAAALKNAPEKKLNYAIISHFHTDHMGAVNAKTKTSPAGGYQLSGITEVGEHLPIEKMIDRNWPTYNWPVKLDDPKMENYKRFLKWQTANKGMAVEQFRVGDNRQIALRYHPEKFPSFEVRNISANGWVWTGKGTEKQNHFPALKELEENNYPRENKCSIAIRLSYGRFDYFTGGDTDMGDSETAQPADKWKDIEAPVGKATGPVDVCKSNHHANYDANSVGFIAALRPRVFVVQTWGATQPAISVYRHMKSKAIYPGPRDIFFTNLMEESKLVLHIKDHDTPRGHIVIRVSPGGAEYFVYVLEDSDESRSVKSIHGPYASR